MEVVGTSRQGTSGGNGDALIDIEGLAKSIREKLDKLSCLSTECCIYKVPNKLKKINEEAYTPRRVSIGPLHHGKEGLEDMEEHKLRYFNDFMQRSGNSLEELIKIMKDMEKGIRDCYAETINFKSDKFLEIILVDAAFIVELLLRYWFPGLQTPNDRIMGKPWMIADVRYDLLLLENQLPLFVLLDLFERTNINFGFNRNETMSYSFICLILNWLELEKIIPELPVLKDINPSKVKHFLDLLRSCLIPMKDSHASIPKEKSPSDSHALVREEESPSTSQASVPKEKSPLDSQTLVPEEEMPSNSQASVPEEKSPLDLQASVLEEKSPSVPEEKSPSDLQASVLEEKGLSVPEEKSPSVLDEKSPSDLQALVLEKKSLSVPEEKSPSVPEEKSPSDLQASVPKEKSPLVLEENSPSDLQASVLEEKSPSVPEENSPSNSQASVPEEKSPSKVKQIIDCIISHLIPRQSLQQTTRKFGIPSATELHQAGVKFKVSSSKNSFDIKFSGNILNIPHTRIVDSTECLLRNIIAYEQCHCDDNYFADYTMLMDFLINTSKDVELLVQAKIIENWLSDNNDVSNLFNGLNKEVNINSEAYHFIELHKELNDYYEIPCHKWKATLKQHYFRTPWRVLSIIVAAILLGLTFIQSLCSLVSCNK